MICLVTRPYSKCKVHAYEASKFCSLVCGASTIASALQGRNRFRTVVGREGHGVVVDMSVTTKLDTREYKCGGTVQVNTGR